MVESAAHLVDQVLREQPIRQWLLIFPYRLRFLFAAQPQVLSGVLGVVYRAISTCLVRKSGFTVASGAKTGAIALIQRFCSASSMMRPVNARSTARSSDTWRSAGRSNAGQKGPDNIFQNRNIGKVEIRGAEFNARFFFNEQARVGRTGLSGR